MIARLTCVLALSASALLACLHATAPPARIADPLTLAHKIWRARFQPFDDVTISIYTLPPGRMGQARCYAREIDLSPVAFDAAEVAVYVALHEMTHMALHCQPTDHDDGDFLLVPQFDRAGVLQEMRAILARCGPDAGCANDRIFSEAIRAKIEQAQARDSQRDPLK